MKKASLSIGLVVATSLSVALGALPVVRADSPEMDDAHIRRIQADCLIAQSTLNRVHESDALLRVNRGQLYESISTKLMAALNSRIALNRRDDSKLSAITATYEQDLNTFRSNYQVYEEQLSTAMKIDCTKQPVAFYDAVTLARTERNTVHDSILTLNTEIKEYSTAFDEFKAAYLAAGKETNS